MTHAPIRSGVAIVLEPNNELFNRISERFATGFVQLATASSAIAITQAFVFGEVC